jgi:hypothetical protein
MNDMGSNWKAVQSSLTDTDIPIAHLESLKKEYAWHPKIQQALSGRLLSHPDITPQSVQASLPSDVPVLLSNPALPFFLLENPNFFHYFSEVKTLFAFINHPATPEWLLQALKQHPDMPVAHATRLHRCFSVLPPRDWGGYKDILCQSPVPLIAITENKATFSYPDTSRRRRFATVPGLPHWVMACLGGNPDRHFSPERLGRMVMEAASSEDDLLVFLAHALSSRKCNAHSTITMASSHRWAERLAATIRPETPEEAMIVLADALTPSFTLLQTPECKARMFLDCSGAIKAMFSRLPTPLLYRLAPVHLRRLDPLAHF